MPAHRRPPPSPLRVIVLSAALVVGCAGEPPAAPRTFTPTAPAPVQLDQRQSVDEQLAELNRVVAATRVVPRLGKGDVLSISVYDEPELTIPAVPVRPDGKISFPLVGDVQAEGRSVDELSADLTW